MTRLFENKKICATMFILFGLSVLVNSIAGGTLPTFGSDPVLMPDAQHVLVADDPFFGPDVDDGYRA